MVKKVKQTGLIFCLLMVINPVFVVAEATVLIASASSIRGPLDKIIQLYQQTHPDEISVSYGASGNLAHQIIRGAPFELFLSANTAFPQRVADAGYHLEPAVVYAVGQLGLFANHQSACRVESGVAGLAEQIRQQKIQRIAIANPELAPYGIAAKQVFERLNLWKEVEGHLAFANSVAQAAQFALSGAADCSLISRSLIHHAGLKNQGRFHPVSTQNHLPIEHQMIVLKQASPAAVRFYHFLQSAQAKKMFARHGFEIPQVVNE